MPDISDLTSKKEVHIVFWGSQRPSSKPIDHLYLMCKEGGSFSAAFDNVFGILVIILP
jgi:predicted GNAT superfamily acetyltransferase